MIYIDASELKSTSRLRQHVTKLRSLFGFDTEDEFISSVSVSDLESRTGADVMLTQRAMPVTDAFLARHLDEGAVLVQLKFGNDFPGSFGARLHESIHRMCSYPAGHHQRVLVSIGSLGCSRTGHLTVNGKSARPKKHYAAYHTAVRHWNRFGVYHPEPRESHVAEMLKALEVGIAEPARREFWPVPPKPGDFMEQEGFDELDVVPPEPVKDWRLTVATFPGVGPKRATALKTAMENAPGAVPELMSALQWMTATKHQRKLMDMPRIPMWGDKTFENCRAWMFGDCDGSIRGDMKLMLELRYEEDK